MRLFIAIQFEENILDALTDFQADLKSHGVTGNYTKRENLHITLAFIGEYGNPDEVLDAMEQVDFKPIEISLDGVGSFGAASVVTHDVGDYEVVVGSPARVIKTLDAEKFQ